MKSVRGFTLIELMVTIAIFAIVAIIAAPSFSDLLDRQDLNSSTSALADTLSKARSKSALERRSITVNLNSNSPDTEDQFNWHPEIRSRYISNNTSIVYRPDGRIQQNPPNVGDIVLLICSPIRGTSRGFSKQVNINQFGLIRNSRIFDGCQVNEN